MILLDPFGCGAGVCVAGGTRPASSPGLSISALSLAHINTRQNLQFSQSQKLQIKKIKNKYPTFATKKQKKSVSLHAYETILRNVFRGFEGSVAVTFASDARGTTDGREPYNSYKHAAACMPWPRPAPHGQWGSLAPRYPAHKKVFQQIFDNNI